MRFFAGRLGNATWVRPQWGWRIGANLGCQRSSGSLPFSFLSIYPSGVSVCAVGCATKMRAIVTLSLLLFQVLAHLAFVAFG